MLYIYNVGLLSGMLSSTRSKSVDIDLALLVPRRGQALFGGAGLDKDLDAEWNKTLANFDLAFQRQNCISSYKTSNSSIRMLIKVKVRVNDVDITVH